MLASQLILYSYRRCPYAMRARMALDRSGIVVEIREISLREKPSSMLAVSPKGTVPVLLMKDSDSVQVIEESLEIMLWALKLKQDNLLATSLDDSLQWIERNDTRFKYLLDRFKYPERYEVNQVEIAKLAGEEFLDIYESGLSQHSYLLSDQETLADLAIFPFVRQYAKVRDDALESYPHLKAWLAKYQNSDAFERIMRKYPTWTD